MPAWKIQTIKLTRIEQDAFFCVCRFQKYQSARCINRFDHRNDVQTVFGREFVVTLVVRRYCHYRACAVIHQDEVCDVITSRTVQWMNRRKRPSPYLSFHCRNFSFSNFGVFTFIDECASSGLLLCRCFQPKGDLQRYRHKYAHQCVWTRGVHFQIF